MRGTGGKEQEPSVVFGSVNSQADVTVFNGKSAFGETQGVRYFVLFSETLLTKIRAVI